MQSLMRSLEGKNIKIAQVGDVGGTGRLVNIQEDYASIWNNRRMIHYPYLHIKSVTTDVTENAEVVALPDVVLPGTFVELLTALLRKKVRIETGEGAREGVLSTLTGNTVSLVVNTKELTIYPIGQIQNISPDFRLKSNASDDPTNDGNEGASGQGGGNGASGQGGGSGSKGDTKQGDIGSSSSNQGEKGGSSTDRQDKNSASSSQDTSSSSNSNSYSAKEQESASHGGTDAKFNKSLAISMLDRLNETYYPRHNRGKTSGNEAGKSRRTVSISSPLPSFLKKNCSVPQNRASK